MNRTDRHDESRTDRLQTDRPQTDRPQTDRESTPMGDVSHTHPYADRGTVNRPFQRGPVVVADGGEREGYDAREEDDEEESEDTHQRAEDAQMRDVDHTPPYDEGDGVDRVFERGGEQEPVEGEE